MSKKSQRRMDQFESKANISLLASFPLGLLKKASIQSITKRTHYDMMIAAAVSVLLSVPLRIKNLSQLQFDRDFTVIREHRRQAIVVHISPEQTKGRQAVEAIIEPPYSTVIVRYIDHHRNKITQSINPYLFPTATGASAREPDHFGTLIKDKIYRETGLTVNPHLFRHFSAYVYLAAHPGAYEDVRRIIGHAKMDTTTGFYASATNKASFKRYSDVLTNAVKGGIKS